MAGEVFRTLQLDRAVIKLVLMELRENRRAQTAFCAIACATRFKFFEHGFLRGTICPKPGCNERDALQHLLMFANLGPVPTEANALVEYLVVLAEMVCPANPGLPTVLTHRGISLAASSSEAEAGELSSESE